MKIWRLKKVTSGVDKDVLGGNNLAIEHVRSELISLLVKIHYYKSTLDTEVALRKLIIQLDDIKYAYDVYQKQEQIELEPVNISEIRDQILHKIYNDNSYKNIMFESKSKFNKPVLANRLSIAKSLESMVYSVVDENSEIKKIINIEISRRSDRVNLGVYSDNFYIDAGLLRQFRSNLNKSTRPVSNFSPFLSTNLFIADTLLSAMGTSLNTSINNKKRGLSVNLSLSHQLELIKL